ncbi:MAG TPA: PH domain-containing protein [Candidatus Saccharimonadales bacterium]
MADQNEDVEQKTESKHVKYFADQFDDEEVLFVFRKHPIVMRRGIILWAIGILLGPLYVLITAYAQPDRVPTMGGFALILLGSVIVSLILFSPSLISWWFSVFIVTNQRFIQITQKGLFHRSVADVGLEHIQSVNYEVAGLNATLLGFGTMKVQTYIGDMLIHELHHPAKIQKRIIGILRDQEIVNMQHAVQAAQAAPSEHRIINEED